MAVIGREAARAPLTSADINDGIVGAADLQSTLDLSSKTLTMPSISSLDVTGSLTVDTATIGSGSGALINGTADDLVVDNSGSGGITVATGAAQYGNLFFSDSGSSVAGYIQYLHGTDYMRFGTNATEAMRIDSSQNLLVGTTDSDLGYTDGDSGVVINGDGPIQAARDSANAIVYLNKLNNDGTIIQMHKDGAQVGSIGTSSSALYIGTGDTGLYFGDTANRIQPWDTTANAAQDATVDLGTSTNRFKDLYLSGGVYLGGTGAANLLDDYETGGWTPEIADAASGGNTGSATASRVIYTKVGRLVTVSAQLLNVDTTGMTAASQLYIRGLPFASASANIAFGSIQTDNLTFRTSRTQIIPMIVASESFLTIKNIGDGLSDLTTLVSDVSSGATDIYFSITYQAA